MGVCPGTMSGSGVGAVKKKVGSHKNVTKVGSRLRSVTQKRKQGRFQDENPWQKYFEKTNRYIFRQESRSVSGRSRYFTIKKQAW